MIDTILEAVLDGDRFRAMPYKLKWHVVIGDIDYTLTSRQMTELSCRWKREILAHEARLDDIYQD